MSLNVNFCRKLQIKRKTLGVQGIFFMIFLWDKARVVSLEELRVKLLSLEVCIDHTLLYLLLPNHLVHDWKIGKLIYYLCQGTQVILICKPSLPCNCSRKIWNNNTSSSSNFFYLAQKHSNPVYYSLSYTKEIKWFCTTFPADICSRTVCFYGIQQDLILCICNI